MRRRSPGECIVCGTAHCACVVDGGPYIVRLPGRDAAASIAPAVATEQAATLPPGRFNTGNYRRPKRGTKGGTT